MAGTRVLKSYECIAYYANGSSNGTPTWVAIPGVQTLSLNLTAKESDVSVRGAGGYELSAATLKSAQIEVNTPYITGDPVRLVLEAAFHAGTVLGFAASDGNIAANGTVSFVGDMQVFSASLEEAIDKTVEQKFTLKPTLALSNSTIVAPSYKTT